MIIWFNEVICELDFNQEKSEFLEEKFQFNQVMEFPVSRLNFGPTYYLLGVFWSIKS